MYALFKAVKYVIEANIPGDFVECGVWKGGSAMLIAHTLMQMKELNRKIYLYDTFEGMPKPRKEDYRLSNEKNEAITAWEKTGKWDYSPLSEVKSNMFSTNYPKENIYFIPGKVEDTIPKTIPTK
jgi:hypothetical protein